MSLIFTSHSCSNLTLFFITAPTLKVTKILKPIVIAAIMQYKIAWNPTNLLDELVMKLIWLYITSLRTNYMKAAHHIPIYNPNTTWLIVCLPMNILSKIRSHSQLNPNRLTFQNMIGWLITVILLSSGKFLRFHSDELNKSKRTRNTANVHIVTWPLGSPKSFEQPKLPISYQTQLGRGSK